MKALSCTDYISLFQSSKHSDVIKHFNDQFSSSLEDPEITKIAAASYFVLGDLTKCFELLSSVESCFSSDVEYLSMYGACCRRLGKLDAAKSLLQKALSYQPDSLPVRNNYANLLIDLNHFDSAEQILNSVLDSSPEYSDAKDNLQRLRLKKDTSFSAKPAKPVNANTFVLADPLSLAFSKEEITHSQTLLSDKTNKKSVEKKTQQLEQILPSISDQSLASDQLALAFKACVEGRHEFAIKLCDEAKSFLADSSSLFECYGDAYIGLKDFTKAEIFLLHSVVLGANGQKIYINLSTLCCIRGDRILATHYYDKAFTLDPSNIHLQTIKSQIDRLQ